jgi:hypothetical protein
VKTITCLIAILATCSMMLAATAHAGSCNGEFGWLGKGTVYALQKGAFIFTGEFSGTLFNTNTSDPTHKMTTQCPGLWHVKGGSGTSNGVCIMRDAAGDKIILEWNGATGEFPVTEGPFTIVAGTGKFEGASGTGMFRGVSVAADDGGNSMGYATWYNCTYTTAN